MKMDYATAVRKKMQINAIIKPIPLKFAVSEGWKRLKNAVNIFRLP
jgi:hypothetical protein